MFIDNATYDLINVFLNSNEFLTVKSLAEKIGKSRRIVYYIIEKLNIELKKNNIENIVNVARKGVLLNDKQKEILKYLIKDVDYILNSRERKLAMSLYICTYPKKHTVESLVETFMVTKNTIIFDINEIKDSMQKFNKNLTIKTGYKGGYVLNGEELVEIQYVYSVLKQIFNSKNTKFIQFVLSLYENVSIIFTDEFIGNLIDKILIFEQKLGKKIAPKDLDNLIFSFPYLYLFAIQRESFEISKDLEKMRERLEYRFLKGLFEDLNMVYNDKILTLFTLIILCTSKIIDEHSASKDYAKHIDLANKMINEFEKYENIQIESRNEIINDIVMYLKVVAIRNEYNIISEDVNVQIIKEHYPNIYNELKNIIKSEDTKLTDENIALLSLIFARVRKIKKLKLLLVIDEGSITRKLIKTKIIGNIKNIEVESIRKSKLYEYDISKIDLIISTENLDVEKDFIKINSIITNEDMLNIFNYMINKS